MPLNDFSKKINIDSGFDHGLRLAAPSAVWPEAVPGNCKKLAALPGRPFHEIGLCLFEWRTCLEYGEGDLPAWLADLGLDFHAHLPLDLPWPQGLEAVSEILQGLTAKIAYLNPRCFVLHPPPDPALLPGLAEMLLGLGLEPRRILLENIAGDDLSRHAAVIEAEGFAVCLDVGHILAYGQHGLLDDPRLASRVAMVHASAPGRGDEHLGLHRLEARGRETLNRCLALLPKGGTFMIECFRPDELLTSLAMLDPARSHHEI